MKTILYCSALACILIPITASQSNADVIVIKTKQHKGLFEKFEKNVFYFRTDSGQVLQEDKGTVSRLDLEPPCTISLLAGTTKIPEQAQLKQYKGMKFFIVTDNGEKTVFASSVKEIIAERPMADNGNGAVDQPTIPRAIDLTDLENNPANTPQQTAAIEAYKTARQKYEQFIQENTNLIAQMDKAKGPAREKMLDQLRLRKNQEQPFKVELQNATKGLRVAFP